MGAMALLRMVIVSLALLQTAAAAKITVDYPADGSVFPPEFPAPTLLFRDAEPKSTSWVIEVASADGSVRKRVKSAGEPMRIGELDPECKGAIPPTLSPEQAAAHTWTPDAETWSAIKQHSVNQPAKLSITGYAEGSTEPVSSGEVAISTSKDPVGAPIFYRDVPIIPSPTEKGVIKPLPSFAIGLIKWRLRNVAETSSKTVMENLPTCVNCHSFSLDGKTLGLDVDGPQNDKGLYALVPVKKEMAIRNEDVIRWSSYADEKGSKKLRLGFMSQVSPDGQYVITSINNRGAQSARTVIGLEDKFYNAGYKDYRFGQVFYPTRGILAWYSRETGKLQPLPGADDPKYVQANAVWSPDGKYLIFARAEARDPYPKGQKMAEYANDPNETQIQYDLYRIPFNSGKGGVAEPVAGASANGMSNNFAKVSPDGRWIVYVQCRNGLLMRPDSQLYMIPFAGGEPRRLNANLPLMNSWHSFAPNGRWMVFSSKGRSAYTQMFLTHLDEQGNDSPAILVENATAANRAVNIPEFVNIPEDGIAKIDAPATEFYRVFDRAIELAKTQPDAAIPEWRKAIELNPEDAKANINLGALLAAKGKADDAEALYRKAIEAEPDYPVGYTNMGVLMAQSGKLDQAIGYFEKAVELSPWDGEAHSNLGGALAVTGRVEEAIEHCRKALEANPADAEANANLAIALAKSGKVTEAIPYFEKALEGNPESTVIQANLGGALMEAGRFAEAIPHFETAVRLTGGQDPQLLAALAVTYARTGRFADAVSTGKKAVEAARRHNNPGLAAALEENLKAFESRVSGSQP
jgi:Flp pilus assembly protein TadD